MEGVDLVAEGVSEEVSVLAGAFVLLNEAVVLQLGVEADSLLDLFHIALIELRDWLSGTEAHVGRVLLISERQSSKNLERRGSHTSLKERRRKILTKQPSGTQ